MKSIYQYINLSIYQSINLYRSQLFTYPKALLLISPPATITLQQHCYVFFFVPVKPLYETAVLDEEIRSPSISRSVLCNYIFFSPIFVPNTSRDGLADSPRILGKRHADAVVAVLFVVAGLVDSTLLLVASRAGRIFIHPIASLDSKARGVA